MEPMSGDDELFAELATALTEADVPPAVRDAGRLAWLWRDLDQELAALVYDSALDAEVGALTRAAGVPRILVFRAGGLSVELELVNERVAGQIVPPGPGQIEALSPTGDTRRAPVDEAGRFELSDVPDGLVRLRLRTPDHAKLVIGWLHLGD